MRDDYQNGEDAFNGSLFTLDLTFEATEVALLAMTMKGDPHMGKLKSCR